VNAKTNPIKKIWEKKRIATIATFDEGASIDET
jgi:hypothetical protein